MNDTFFVYVMFQLNSGDTRKGMTYANDIDIQLGNGLYEQQRQVNV